MSREYNNQMLVQDPMKVEVDWKGKMVGDAFILDILQKFYYNVHLVCWLLLMCKVSYEDILQSME